MTPVKVIKVDPWHKVYGYLFTEVLQKVAESMHSIGDEDGATAAMFGSLVVKKDPGAIMLAAVDPTGHVKGVAAACIFGGEATIIQPRLDVPTENDAVKEMMDILEDWADNAGFDRLTLITRRIDQKWTKKFGFEVSRYILQKELS